MYRTSNEINQRIHKTALNIITQTGLADQTINKSRFIAVAQYCADERAVMMLLRQLASEHSHANHLVFAYRLQNPEGSVSIRFHDAGEPSGTAGKPVLQYIEGRDLVNACVAVVRYFGGVKLGTGGLARAYGGTARLALEAATIAPFVQMQQLRFTLDYPKLESFTRELGKTGGQLLDKQFGEKVTVVASIPADQIAAFKARHS
jgi:uncharacterized YigZ family protein